MNHGKDADIWVTTDKDAVKLKGLIPEEIPVYSMGVKVSVDDEPSFLERILEAIRPNHLRR